MFHIDAGRAFWQGIKWHLKTEICETLLGGPDEHGRERLANLLQAERPPPEANVVDASGKKSNGTRAIGPRANSDDPITFLVAHGRTLPMNRLAITIQSDGIRDVIVDGGPVMPRIIGKRCERRGRDLIIAEEKRPISAESSAYLGTRGVDRSQRDYILLVGETHRIPAGPEVDGETTVRPQQWKSHIIRPPMVALA